MVVWRHWRKPKSSNFKGIVPVPVIVPLQTILLLVQIVVAGHQRKPSVFEDCLGLLSLVLSEVASKERSKRLALTRTSRPEQ